MLKFSELKNVQLEITNNCQASCPMCSRNINGGIVNPQIKHKEWTLSDFQHIMNPEVLQQLESFHFCGVYGDPLLNNNLLEMCRYSAATAPDTKITISTNGSMRNPSWWRELANTLPVNHKVIFALDGLQDTHKLYRVGTDFNKIILNATAFIEAGGNASWFFIRFKHNEHQVEAARQMSEKLGFKEFSCQDSGRFNTPLYPIPAPVVDRDGKILYSLEPASRATVTFYDLPTKENFISQFDNIEIQCKAQQRKEVYIDAYKDLFPCCWLGATEYNSPKSYFDYDRVLGPHKDMMSRLGDVNVMHSSIKDIVDSQAFQTIWQELWQDKKLLMCVGVCGTKKIN